MARKLPSFTRIPVSTYRLQLNHRFRFSDATAIVPYLHDLGISECYTSPYFEALPGSLHGYDILDHNTFNPEIGTEAEHTGFMEELKRHGLGHTLDIVPNHMSIGGDQNRWWMDILENGPSSIHADCFDIDWKPVKDELEDKVLLPILGNQYGLVLENQELKLSFDEGAFFVQYWDRTFPVAPLSYNRILRFRIDTIEKQLGKDHPHLQELLSIATAIDHLPPRTEKDQQKISERRREKEIIKKRLSNLTLESEAVRSFIDENITLFNGKEGDPRSFDLLDDLLNDQVYRLSFWRVATEEINYRRFFDINELAAIRMENLHIFRETHRLIFKLIRENKITGLRVDHPDGLYDPKEYFSRLQKGCFVQFALRAFPNLQGDAALEEEIGRLYDEASSTSSSSILRMPLYIVGEKILTKSERMPEDWPIFSTTGYVFLNSVNGIFIDMEREREVSDLYARFTRSKVNYQDLVYEKKKLVMQTSMPSEINTLGYRLNRISEKNRHTRDFTLNSLTTAILEVIAHFPVYRTYATRSGVNERDRRYIEHAVSRAKRRNPALSETIFDFLQRVLFLQYPEDFDETDREEWLDFAMRFQQITSPVMAKGLEDTAFYVYNRFVSLNEVGGNPERFGTPLDTFHGQNIERTKFWPYAMITTATHDTKRSEDVKARLNVLSEIPEEWRQTLFRWNRFNRRAKSVMEGQEVPDRNEEVLLYQTLIGVWPLHPMTEAELGGFKQRIKDYMIKAAREAKVNTSWISPNISYEEDLLKFIEGILSPSPHNHFLRDLETFQKRVSYWGMFNSLSQILLKMTCPGVPDFYQGTEIWDFSLVDPDNRRPVDYSLRVNMLRQLREKAVRAGNHLSPLLGDLLLNWKEGSIKLYVTWKTLNYRKENARLFMDGDYLPVAAEGTLKNHVCAFARVRERQGVLIVVPRFLTRLIQGPDELPLGRNVWGDSAVVLPDEITVERFRDVFTHDIIEPEIREGKRVLSLGELFKSFPVALVNMEERNG
ncbi:MAG: malto-oligosyltrehalose synthase [Deltaproteobacteria bacterium RBG_13_52_11b]|nr:MAG: malto-oligosyltrehalose synthase [Deltaproteobacteria bacterium RBG_13_52_11b]